MTITRQGRAVTLLVSIERMEAIAETMELLADPEHYDSEITGFLGRVAGR